MIMKKFILFILTLFLSYASHANEKITKLNELYLNGVLDKSSYMSSLENLGINTSNDIFINLFDLFSDKTLDIATYEKSLNNLTSLSSSSKSDNNLSSNQISTKDNNKAIKLYGLSNCKGASDLCNDLAESEFPFYKENDQVVIDKTFVQMVVDSDMSLQSIMGSKNFLSNDKFDHIVRIRHIKGFLLDFKFGGYIEGNDFFLTNMSLRGNGKEVISSDLKLL